MLWVDDHYKYFNSYSAGIDFRRQILTSKVYLRAVRVNPYSSDVFFLYKSRDQSFIWI